MGETVLEQVLKEEGQASEEEEVKAEEEPQVEEAEEVEEKPVVPEAPDVFESRVQAEVDTRTNSYRDKREADLAYIDSLKTLNRELKSAGVVKGINKLADSILAGDEEEGLETDKIEVRKKSLDEIKGIIKEYKEQSVEVEEAAQVISQMTKAMPDNIVKEFGLNDSNPNIRAVNGAKFLEETVSVYKHNQDFLMVVEGFLPKGDELRKQVEEIVDGMAEFESEKSKKLYLKDRLQGVKVTPRKKPLAPSDITGGVDLSKLDDIDLIERGLRKMAQKT